MAETASQAFLGMSIGCAKCHNHPMEKWTNNQYYQMANLFARVRFKSGATGILNFVMGWLGQPEVASPIGDVRFALAAKRELGLIHRFSHRWRRF